LAFFRLHGKGTWSKKNRSPIPSGNVRFGGTTECSGGARFERWGKGASGKKPNPTGTIWGGENGLGGLKGIIGTQVTV